MAHNRCAHCRNPIRHGNGLSTPSADAEVSWFHHDCWAAVLSAKQEEYHQRIQARGIDALIAPYVSRVAAVDMADTADTAVKLMVVQASPPHIEAVPARPPVDSRKAVARKPADSRKPGDSGRMVDSGQPRDESETA